MKLTEQEIEHIKPGIYRTSHWPDNPPKLIEPKNEKHVTRYLNLRKKLGPGGFEPPLAALEAAFLPS